MFRAKIIENEENSKCRMYENKYPNIGEFVHVVVRNITDIGVYVSLLEYNGIEGMILLSELSKKRIRSINQLTRVGKIEIAVVLRVDEIKGYIDLSKCKVSTEDAIKCEERYTKSKTVHNIMNHIADTLHFDLEVLYNNFCWDLYKKYDHACDAFRLIASDKTNLKILDNYDIDDNVKESLLKIINRRMAPTVIKLQADIIVTCFGYHGVEAIKSSLIEAEDNDIKITLLSPPKYIIKMSTYDRESGIAKINDTIIKIKNKIMTYDGGNLSIEREPYVMMDNDEVNLKKMMKKIEDDDKEVEDDDI